MKGSNILMKSLAMTEIYLDEPVNFSPLQTLLSYGYFFFQAHKGRDNLSYE